MKWSVILMSRNSDKYIMFKNFLHNELNINKELILNWINEAINNIAIKLIENTYSDIDIEKLIRSRIERDIDKKIDIHIKEEVKKRVLQNIKVYIKVNEGDFNE
jgi:hypothetical protein